MTIACQNKVLNHLMGFVLEQHVSQVTCRVKVRNYCYILNVCSSRIALDQICNNQQSSQMILTRSSMIIKKAKYKKVSKCQNLKKRQRKYINFGLVLSKFTKEFIQVHWLGKKLPMDLKTSMSDLWVTFSSKQRKSWRCWRCCTL